VSPQNNKQAEMTQGVQIPIQTVANNTVTVTFKDAALKLLVTPRITAANTVIMDVELENATPDYPAGQQHPPIDTQRARLGAGGDGATTVIGIYVSRRAVRIGPGHRLRCWAGCSARRRTKRVAADLHHPTHSGADYGRCSFPHAAVAACVIGGPGARRSRPGERQLSDIGVVCRRVRRRAPPRSAAARWGRMCNAGSQSVNGVQVRCHRLRRCRAGAVPARDENPSVAASPASFITVSRYRVVFRRADGPNR
jgi:hypothetical protein